PRVERPNEASITLELGCIAEDLALDECIDVGALMRSGLEVDDPARAFVNEAAIDDDVRNGIGFDAGERPFGARVLVTGVEQPTSARIAQERFDRRENDRSGAIELVGVHTLSRQLAAD